MSEINNLDFINRPKKLPYGIAFLYIATFAIPFKIIDAVSINENPGLFAYIVFTCEQLASWFVTICLFIPNSGVNKWFKTFQRYSFYKFAWVGSTIGFTIVSLSLLHIIK